jgi:inosine-uridine nucleoside N-ribohydrolase
MGGGSEGGNTTPTAEFSIFADPHAAQADWPKNVHFIREVDDHGFFALLTERIARL